MRALGPLDSDFVRWPGPLLAHAPRQFREWLHFCVLADGFDVIVNVCLTQSPAGAEDDAAQFALFVHRAGRWSGGLDRYRAAEVSVGAGRLEVGFAANSIAKAEGGSYRARGELRSGSLRLDLAFHRVDAMGLAAGTRIDPQTAMNWFVLPRLAAEGQVWCGGECLDVRDAFAYHDHNWGGFGGRDFAWDWGFGWDPRRDSPWSIVYCQLFDRSRFTTLTRGLFVWHHDRPARIFRDHELQFDSLGRHLPEHSLLVPGPLGLVCPRALRQVPLEYRMTALSPLGDDVRCTFVPEAVVNIAMPEGTGRGLSVVSETRGRLRVSGVCARMPVTLETNGYFEFTGS